MIIDKVNDILNSNTNKSTLYVLCSFIKKNIEQIPSMSIDDIAKSSYMSKGQVSKCIRNLDYQNYEDFRYACYSYLDSLQRRKMIKNHELSFQDNIIQFTKELSKNIQYSLEHININDIQEIIKSIRDTKILYLYAQGDARSLCYNIQRELNIYHISTVICDVDFQKKYTFSENNLLIILSTNGNSFHFDKRIINRIQNTKVRKWLITCKDSIKFCDKQLFIPTLDNNYNEYIIRHIIDIILLNFQN
ncbi:MurR/RpiR family transcriptional regulator [Clostridium sp. Sa3CUN1]|uniref:MurR/RpiR family transcriptional regulator n=1 Tax=Clostridium gallinarum TaxID=2762246 RepID=A0ABR8Q080_9CLOT|nr:MurR/RpiR family transcriptional regulator [Clostridium gallinarum]MBD7913828.1 MurR/RpiR family transcriptional regulator [Clostridium gallinarum]